MAFVLFNYLAMLIVIARKIPLWIWGMIVGLMSTAFVGYFFCYQQVQSFGRDFSQVMFDGMFWLVAIQLLFYFAALLVYFPLRSNKFDLQGHKELGYGQGIIGGLSLLAMICLSANCF